MSLGSKKGMKGSIGTSFIVEKIPGTKRLSCYNCSSYNSDNSCSSKPVIISEIGYNFWMQCDRFSLDYKYDNEQNRQIVARQRKLKKDKKKKNKQNNASNITTNNNVDVCIYPTEKGSSILTYAKRGKSKAERASDEKARKSAEKRARLKYQEDTERYNNLIRIIGYRSRFEKLYIKHFNGSLDTLDFIDEVDNIIAGKNINESDLVFIREYLYKKYK